MPYNFLSNLILNLMIFHEISDRTPEKCISIWKWIIFFSLSQSIWYDDTKKKQFENNFNVQKDSKSEMLPFWR